MFLIGAKQPNFCFWSSLGTGKSALALYLIKYRHEKDKPALVFCHDESNVLSWVTECEKFVPDLKVIPVIGTKLKRRQSIIEKADIYLVTYDCMRSLFSEGRSTKIVPSDVAEFAIRFKTVVWDEITATKHTQSIAFQVCRVISKYAQYRYGLSGRPFGRQSLDLWPQMFLIDHGNTLGKNINLFKQTFFLPKYTPFGTNWIPDDSKKELFHKTLKHRSIYFPAVKLPPPITSMIQIDLSPEAKVYYRKLRGDVVADLKSSDWKAKIKNPFVKFRQICSGYLKVDTTDIDETTGKEVTVKSEEIHFENNKLPVLERLISLLPMNKKMIIFYVFTPSGRAIVDKLTDMRVKHTWLWGGTKSRKDVLDQFKNDPKCRVLVANIDSGSTGLNLQHACYSIFYEMPDSVSNMAQALGRTWRRGQEDQVYVYEFVIRNSIEEKLVKFISDGQDLFEELIVGHLLEEEKERTAITFIGSLRTKSGVIDAIGKV